MPTALIPAPVPTSRDAPHVHAQVRPRVRVAGKFLFRGDEKLYVRGVTYGTFAPGEHGAPYPPRDVVERDFQDMARHNINAVRVYTPPPPWLLDTAVRYGLVVMIGLPWEQHVAFLDDPGRDAAIIDSVRDMVRAYVNHPAVLCFTIGNEIPAPIVRWSGPGRVEQFLYRLYCAVKSEDPAALVTYVNFPTTEYLKLPFVDFVCFNVYLEDRGMLDAYLARLQTQAGDRPLVLAELGLDSQRNGEARQAESLAWQIEAAFAAGAAGVFTFAWTDEWHRGGAEIDDWDFGLVRRDRSPKPALGAVSRAYARVPFPRDLQWPRVSVVVCTYNGRRTIRDTFEALQRLDYPDFEVVVVSDGSSDGSVALAYGYRFTVVAGPNRGLSAARNIGFQTATGSIVAYVDDDAYPDPHWLQYVAHSFMTSGHAAVGGPNIAPPDAGWIADCVANAPGGPSHVLISDREAEHIPGCNMAYRKTALEALGGFDPFFRIAGDDVDLCWRLLDDGQTIGFSPAAMVWHYRRNSLRAYWRQQKNYGKAEGMLEQKWPRRFSAAGHPSWAGRVYGKGHTAGLHILRNRIYQGVWGLAPFQAIYEQPATIWEHLPLMPEWYLVNTALVCLGLLGMLWAPLYAALGLLAISAGIPVVQAIVSARRAEFPTPSLTPAGRYRRVVVTAMLHLAQPLARLLGRLSFGLAPWRIHATGPLVWPRERKVSFWSEAWKAPEARLETLRAIIVKRGGSADAGTEFDTWDLRARGGLMGSVLLLMAHEDHAAGRQLLRFLVCRRASHPVRVVVPVFALVAGVAAIDGAWVACAILGTIAGVIGVRTLLEQAAGLGTVVAALQTYAAQEALVPVPPRSSRRPAAAD